MKKYITKNQRISDLEERNRKLLQDIYTLIDNDNKKQIAVAEVKFRYKHHRAWEEIIIGTAKAHIDFLSGTQERPTEYTVDVYVKNTKKQSEKLKELKPLALRKVVRVKNPKPPTVDPEDY